MNNGNIIHLPPLELNEWDIPILFDEIQTPEITADLLPKVFAEFASAQAIATETAESMSVMVILGVISTAAARHFRVSPKPRWIEPLNIYTMIGLPPANNKTQVLNNCTLPLVDWEKQQAEILKPEMQRQISERKTQEKIIESLRSKVSKEKDKVAQQGIICEITEMEASLIEPKPLPLLFVNDATPEALVTNVHEQGGNFAVISDEGGIIEALAGLYSGGNSNVDIILKGIDGGHVRVRRKDRSIDLNPYLTIVLATQPIIIQNMAAKKAYTGNGILERFLYVLPKSKLGYRTHNNPSIPKSISDAYYQAIRSLLDISKQMPDAKQPQLLTLSPVAYQSWRNFQSDIETELRPDGRLSICLGWGGKICGFALRIAGLLHIAEHGMKSLVIEDNIMTNALIIAEFLTHHAVAAYTFMGIDEVTHDAKEIFQWINAQNKPSFTRSEITLAMRNRKLGKNERLNKALSMLIDRNIVEVETLPTQKPTTVFHINPKIKGEATQQQCS